MPKFRVKYARIVLMETIVVAQTAEEVLDLGQFPNVYDGVPTESVPEAVQDVVDYDSYWKIVEIDAGGNEIGSPLEP